MQIKNGLFACLALIAAPAFADDTGFYVGAGMGYSNLSINEKKLDNRIDAALPAGWLVTGSNTDQHATPYQFFFGYRLMPYLAAEVAYIDMGSANYKGYVANSKSLDTGTIAGSWSAKGWPLSVLGIWPINDTFEAFGRVGLFMGSVDFHSRAFDSAGTIARYNKSQNSNEFFGGLGVDAKFHDNWSARFEWQAMPSVGNNDTGSGDFNNLILSIIYKF